MQYWLRRNNIDHGPFNKEALLSHGLIPSDLIKVDGGSVWKSPNSFAELQQGLQGTPKPKYKFTADKKLIEIKDEDNSKRESPTPKGEPPAAGPSPFKRMPSALPKKKPTAAPAVDKTNIAGNEKAKERARLNARGESPVPPVQTPSNPHNQAQASIHGHQKVHAQVQSLDEAPLREVRHHPTPKPIRTASRPQNSHFFKEFFLPIIIIGGIGFLAWWGYKQFTTPSSNAGITAASLSDGDSLQRGSGQQDSQKYNTASKDKAEGPAAIPMHQSGDKTSQQKTAAAGHNATARDSSQPANASTKPAGSAVTQATKPTATTPPPANTTTKTAAQNTPAQKGGDTDKNEVAITKPVPVKTDPPVEKKSDTPASTPAKKEAPKKEPVKKTQKSSSIADYVSLSLNKAPESGIKNIKIKVNNNSKDDLNIAVVEIKYYDKDGKFVQGETLQTGKIKAGKSTTLKVPNSKNAERISYKVSLISGDNVYLMGR